MIPLKSEAELQKMREAGKIASQVMQKLREAVRPGVTTGELDRLAEELIIGQGAKPVFKGYRGFPASICASINEEIVHGIPGERALLEGDIISIDLGVSFNGYLSDMAVTVGVGEIDAKKKKLLEVTKNSLSEGIRKAKAGNRLTDISWAIQQYVEQQGFSVVRQFVGHGIGTSLHEEPEVPNFGRANEGPVLKAGMVLAIEPMVNMGSWESEITDNGWTAVTKDHKLSAHFEHTVAVTEKGGEILTR